MLKLLNIIPFTIGKYILTMLSVVGNIAIFFYDFIICLFTPPFYLKSLKNQIIKIGYNSLPVIGLTAFFTGGVLALQIYIGGSRFNAENIVASIVALGITRELGPVIAGLMLAGRVSASHKSNDETKYGSFNKARSHIFKFNYINCIFYVTLLNKSKTFGANYKSAHDSDNICNNN